MRWIEYIVRYSFAWVDGQAFVLNDFASKIIFLRLEMDFGCPVSKIRISIKILLAYPKPNN